MAWTAETIYDLSRKAHNRLTGVMLTAETNDTNNTYKDYVARLAWKPDLDVYNFVSRYAATRYSSESVATMVDFWKHILHGPLGVMGRAIDKRTRWASFPQYTLRPDQQNFEIRRPGALNIKYHYDQRALLCVRNELEALKLGLQVAEREKDNYFYKRDMVEVTRDLLAELYNQHFYRAEKAFLDGDRQAFDRHSKACLSVMDMLTELLESVFNWPDFSFAARWKAAENSIYKMRDKQEALHWMTGYDKDEQGKPFIKDRYFYWRSSFYEAVRDMYKPWAIVYFNHLKNLFDRGERKLPSSEEAGTPEELATFGWFTGEHKGKGTLGDAFRKIALDFAFKPLETEKVGELQTGNPIPVIRSIIQRVKSNQLAHFNEIY
jgi:hypothetical protein